MTRRIALIAAALFLIASTPDANGQALSTDGTDFLLPQGGTAYIGSYTENRAIVFGFDSLGYEVPLDTVFLHSNSTVEISLYDKDYQPSITQLPSFQLFHLVSTDPVGIQVMLNRELYLALPTQMLGSRYEVESYPTNLIPFRGRSYFILQGVFDSTHVSISPITGTGLPTSTLTLGRGQAIFVDNPFDLGDLSAVMIVSSAPIGVLAGQELAVIPRNVVSGHGLSFQNPLIEQMRPIKDWTKDGYVAIPFLPPPIPSNELEGEPGDVFRVYTSSDSTAVRATLGYVPAKYSSGITRQRGALFRLDSIQVPSHFASSDSIDISMIGTFQGLELSTEDPITYGAPMMTNVIPVSRWQNRAIWEVPRTSYYRQGQYANVIYRRSGFNSLKIYRNDSIFDFSKSILASYDIPDYPDLAGMTLQMIGGSYAAYCDSGFILYNYGKANGQLKGTAGYAAPCGFVGASSGITSSKILKLDSAACYSWSGFILDSGTQYKASQLVLSTDSAFAASLGIPTATNIKGSTWKASGDTAAAFAASVIDLTKSAKGYLYLHDYDGYHLQRSFSYAPPRIGILDRPRLQSMYKGQDTCVTIRVVNNVAQGWGVDSLSTGLTGEFRISVSTPPLPATLALGDTLTLRICCLPLNVDTSIIDSMRFSVGCTGFSFPLSISTFSSHVQWLTQDTAVTLTCGLPDTVRVWIANTNAKNVQETISSIDISGADASDFSIVNNQLHYASLTNFPLDAGERMWIDVAFHPDMTKPEPARWADRHATIVATNSLHTDPDIALTAHILHSALSCDQTAANLGTLTLGATGQATLTIRDTGDAPLVIQAVRIGDARIAVTGVQAGDTILPGQIRTITLVGTSSQPDSIATRLTIDATPSCANSLDIPVSFIAYSTRVLTTTLAADEFSDAFTCTRETAAAIFTNSGTDAITVDHISITGSNEFTFDDGSHSRVLKTFLPPDSSLRVEITSAPSAPGVATATLTFFWDSIGVTTADSTSLRAHANTAMAALHVEAPIVSGGAAPSDIIEVPIALTQAPPPGMGVQGAILTVRYRGDLFDLKDVSSSFAVRSQSVISDGAGNASLTLILTSPTGFPVDELLRLRLKVMLAADTETSIDVASIQFFGADLQDSLCIDVSGKPSSFKPSDVCSTGAIRTFMNSGSMPLEIENIRLSPATGSILVSVRSLSSATLHYELTNLLGGTLVAVDRPCSLGGNTTDLELHVETDGVYFLTVSNGEAIIRRKFVLAR